MSDDLTLAVAHGLSPKVLATWSSEVRRNPRVLVPVGVDALVVRDEGGTWADCRMRTPASDDAPANEVLPPPFAERPPRSRGVYLHWALPDALTRGRADADATTRFPAVPDRWLILRLFPAPDRRAVRGWVLLAGGAEPVVRPLDGWVEPGPSQAGEGAIEVAIEQPLTALGHGDPGWAAYFDNVEGRLGFHDPLDDVAAGPLAYVVCGWHADPALDPLGEERAASPALLAARLRDLGWSIPGLDLDHAARTAETGIAAATALGLAIASPPTPAFWPRTTLYHGAVVGLGWPAAAGVLGDLPGGPPPAQEIDPTGEDPRPAGNAVGVPAPDLASPIRVAVGRTTAEALAALLARRGDEARLVEAFQLGILDELDRPDGRARVDARLHAGGFVSYPGGETVEKVWEPATPSPPSPPSTPGVRVAPVETVRDVSALALRMRDVRQGRLREVLAASPPPTTRPPDPRPAAGRWVDVTVPLPRFYAPADPVLLIEGARRSFRHGGDGRFAADGTLACRVSGTAVRELATTGARGVRAEELLARSVSSGSCPVECEEILREAALLDPGSAAVAAARAAGPKAAPPAVKELERRFVVEQTAWWALRDRRVDAAPLTARSGLVGTVPSPLAIAAPTRPWTPLHVDWRAEYWPATGAGQLDGDLDLDLDLGALDLAVRGSPPTTPPSGALTLEGRTRLTAGAAEVTVAAAHTAIVAAHRAGSSSAPEPGLRARFASPVAADLSAALGRIAVPGGSELADVAAALEGLDVLGGTLDPLVTTLRGGVPGDGESTAGAAPPTPFVAFAAGWLRLTRLRLVDCFGQVVELAGTPTWSEPMAEPARPDLGRLAPRFTAPARLLLRCSDAAGGPADASHDVSPVIGFVMPNHLDGSLEVYGAGGDNLGSVRPADAGLDWNDAPGRPSFYGAAPERAIANPFLAGLARGLLDWGAADAGQPREGALAALLRVIDTTLWTVDPYGATGDEHLALLLGHPIVVVRARARLEVRDPVTPAWPPALRLPCRLGALEHWQDGLLGWYVDDDYRTFHCPAAAPSLAREVGPGRGFLSSVDVASHYLGEFARDLAGTGPGITPVTHPMLDATGLVWLRPGVDVQLTLLVEPNALIHATCGALPRKDIALRREWLAPGLSRLAPAFRFGPLLVDPRRVRMPVPTEIPGSWSWDHRSQVATWARAAVVHDPGDAVLAPDPPRGSEGWLRLIPEPSGSGGDD